MCASHRASREIQAGCVWINDHIPIVSEMPYGGFKQSGIGKDMSSTLRGVHPDQRRIVRYHRRRRKRNASYDFTEQQRLGFHHPPF